MSVLRLKYKDKKGRVKRIRNWYCEFRDAKGILRRMPAYPDKGASIVLETKILELVSCTKANIPERVFELSRWFKQQPIKIQNSLAKFGLLDVKKVGTKALVGYLGDFLQFCIVSAPNVKDKTHAQARLTCTRIRKTIVACHFETWADINADKIQLFLHDLGTSAKPRTVKCYGKAILRFARWGVKQGYITEVPELANITIPRRPERCFEYDEYDKLLEAIVNGPVSYGLAGYQRYLCYLTAVETGLRRGELCALTPASLDLKKRIIYVPGDDTKNSDAAQQHISPELSMKLAEYTKNMLPNVKLFDLPNRTAAMIQSDCIAAGVTVQNVRGRIKFHSLRHTCASFLIDQGVDIKTVSEILRHSSIELTCNIYGHLLRGSKESAIAGLGRFSVRQAKTGT